MPISYNSGTKKWVVEFEPEKLERPPEPKTEKQKLLVDELLKDIEKEEKENIAKNNAYRTVMSAVNNTRGGDYVANRDLIRNLTDIDKDTKARLENFYKTFYTNEKIKPWDISLAAKPEAGAFDPVFYGKQNPELAERWKQAVANDDVDITERYGETGYYLYHYSTQGKAAGLRANKVEKLSASENYLEKAPTDEDIRLVRSKQLGINDDVGIQRALKIPQIAEAWQKAKTGDSHWQSLGKKYLLNPKKAEDFVALFRLSDRPEDVQVAFNNNLNVDFGISQLEDALNEVVGEKAKVDIKSFGALRQDALKQTIEEIKKARKKEQELSFLSSIPAFKEVNDITKNFKESLLGDSGIGGVLSYMGKKDEFEKKLDSSLKGLPGVNNNTTYNWQQWFDTQLKNRYQQDIELGYSTEKAKENMKVQGEFAREFIDNYLTPRFNASKSMDEFLDYLELDQAGQNAFQVQDMYTAARNVADTRSKQYLDQLKQETARGFDPDFYFNPTGNTARQAQYQEQANTVTSDWEKAKEGDTYWKEQAYRYGVDLNNKEDFARLHFQVKGQGKGYDAADDILNAGKINDFINQEIIPSLKDVNFETANVFGKFVDPNQYANELLGKLAPGDTENWNKLLKTLNLTDFTGSKESLSDYIASAIRTDSGQNIRDKIKLLNEASEKPTQEKLGITYIEREADKAAPTEETSLYKAFKSAGFQGDEDTFYKDLFPDVDREEQKLLTQVANKKMPSIKDFKLSDPYTITSSIDSLFKTIEPTKTKETKDKYSTIEEDDDFMSALGAPGSGQDFLKGFTSLFSK